MSTTTDPSTYTAAQLAAIITEVKARNTARIAAGKAASASRKSAREAAQTCRISPHTDCCMRCGVPAGGTNKCGDVPFGAGYSAGPAARARIAGR